MDYRNFRTVAGTTLYRGSKPDVLRYEQLEHLGNLGIKCIIDLRSPLEATGSAVNLPVDHKYQAFRLTDAKKSESKFTEWKTKKNTEHKFIGRLYLWKNAKGKEMLALFIITVHLCSPVEYRGSNGNL